MFLSSDLLRSKSRLPVHVEESLYFVDIKVSLWSEDPCKVLFLLFDSQGHWARRHSERAFGLFSFLFLSKGAHCTVHSNRLRIKY